MRGAGAGAGFLLACCTTYLSQWARPRALRAAVAMSSLCVRSPARHGAHARRGAPAAVAAPARPSLRPRRTRAKATSDAFAEVGSGTITAEQLKVRVDRHTRSRVGLEREGARASATKRGAVMVKRRLHIGGSSRAPVAAQLYPPRCAASDTCAARKARKETASHTRLHRVQVPLLRDSDGRRVTCTRPRLSRAPR